MKASINIRDARSSDEADWRRLWEGYGVFYETDLSGDVLDHVWSALMGGALRGFVAEQDGVVVGFAHARSHVATFSVGEDWYLEDLFVDSSARASGIGTAIIEHLVKIATWEGGGTLRWVTAESNATAQRVYDKLATRTSWVTYEVELGG